MTSRLIATSFSALLMLSACDAQQTANQGPDMTRPSSQEGAELYFANLQDGQHVKSPLRIIFGLKGLGVAPAGVDKPNTGHHHLLIDTTLSAEEMQYAITKDDQHRHFGGGQTEAVIELTPGPHTLQLVLGDLNHEVLDPPLMSKQITVIVE
ncbi:MAG: DUF4399 domain-containing protein [Sphingomonadales bacterium]